MNNDSSISRRDFLKHLALASAGSGLLLNLLVRNLYGFPWEERTDSLVLSDTGDLILSPMHPMGKGIKEEYPCVAITSDNRVFTAYVSEKKSGEGIFLREFLPNKEFGEEIAVSSSTGFEYQPRMIADDDNLYVIWSSKRGGGFSLFFRMFKGSEPGPEICVSGEETLAWNPRIAMDSQKAIWAAWETLENDAFQIHFARYKDGAFEKPVSLTNGQKDNRRPSLCCDSLGTVWCAWDRYEGDGNLDIFMKALNKIGNSEIRITYHPAADLAPSLAADKKGRVFIAWHSNRKGEDSWDIPRWFYLRALQDGGLMEPVTSPRDMNLEKHGEDQSFEFAEIACGGDGRVIILGRMSHNYCMQWYKKDGWSRLYRFPKDGWGGRGKNNVCARDSSENIWFARRDLNMNVLQSLEGMNGMYEEPVLKPFHPPLEISALGGMEKNPHFPSWNDFHFYFGDIHAHSWMSDGTGDLDEFYITHRDALKDDFGCLSDHDTFVGNSMIPSEWEEQKATADHFNEPERFITFFGQEWTTARWPAKFGHKNIYHIDPAMPLLDHMDDDYSDTAKLFLKAKNLGAICIPHHIGWTGVDWENHDPDVQPLVEIVSNHGAFEYMGNEPIYHRGGIHGCFVLDGLERGLKFGFVGGSDTHGLIWHHRVGWKRNCLRTGLACILAKDLTRESLFDAMKKRRTYATSGIRMRIVFELSGAMMGEEISLSEPPRLSVNVMCPHDMKWLQIVRNGETIYSYGGEGYQSRFSYRDDKIQPGVSSYYLRVITEDGNMGWSSPVWVKYPG
ncbi:CehA/McbA family metallohydrolase [Candidatus Sumerlaeota bacterium]|nr:CehA/McbA family metallohydrolase [Candidatus Sumerlaeota bacterium]